MGAPSDQILCIEYGGPLRSVSSLIMEASLCLLFCILYRGPSDQFLSILYWGPQLTFFAYYMGAPQIIFFPYNMRAPLRSVSLLTICPLPLRLVSLHAIGGPPQISFFTKYMGAPSDGGPLRSVSLYNI